MWHCRHCLTMADYRNSLWRPPNDSNYYPHLRHSQTWIWLLCRRLLTTEAKDGGHRNRKLWPPSWIPVISSRLGYKSARVWHGRKCRGSRWNRVASSFQLIVVSLSGFRGRHLECTSVAGQCRQCCQCQVKVGRGRNFSGRSWNRVYVAVTVQKLFPLPVWWLPSSWIGIVNNVGRCRHCHVQEPGSF